MKHLGNKPVRYLFLAGLLLLLLAAVATANGGLSVDWHTIDGGGGIAAASSYQLEGTIGQPEGGHQATGDSYQLNGGYWGAAAPASYAIYLPIVQRP